MLQDKERYFYENLILKKMSEVLNRNITLEALKADEHGKQPDVVDQAALNNNRNITMLLLEKNNMQISGFKDALERVREGSYGICEECSEKISRKRLKAVPFARLCINCQTELETKPRALLC